MSADGLNSFIAKRASFKPSLVGEANRDATALSDDPQAIALRTLVAPLHPFGAGHLVYNLIWPAFLAAEEAATKIGAETSSATHQAGKMEELEAVYSAALSNLEVAMTKARRIISLVEDYVHPS